MRIRIIYTGGTFGMRPTAKGYAPAGDLAPLLDERVPELHQADIELDAYDEPIDSAAAVPADWYRLAQRLQEARSSCDGFIVIHGTDTLAYTGSALSFLLGALDRPVVVTGSQVPLVERHSDGRCNLLSALRLAESGALREVAVVFGRQVLRANRTTKVDAEGFDAFASPRFPAIATIGSALRFTELPIPAARANPFGSPPAAVGDASVAALQLHPGMPARLVETLIDGGTKGLVLCCYGTGTGPSGAFLEALRRASEAGMIIVAVSQCLRAHVDLARYAAGSALLDAGVVSGHDMTLEAAFTKLHALLALRLPREDVVRHLQRDLAGELREPGSA